jgi:hypothetical protein
MGMGGRDDAALDHSARCTIHLERVNGLGDMVLRAVGTCLESVFRNEDVPCRFGGEEFVVLLPGADVDVAARRAEQFRSKVEALVVRYVEKSLPRVPESIGVASFPEAGDFPDVVLKAADEALYRAKESGSNRVELSSLATAGSEDAPPRPAEMQRALAAQFYVPAEVPDQPPPRSSKRPSARPLGRQVRPRVRSYGRCSRR